MCMSEFVLMANEWHAHTHIQVGNLTMLRFAYYYYYFIMCWAQNVYVPTLDDRIVRIDFFVD